MMHRWSRHAPLFESESPTNSLIIWLQWLTYWLCYAMLLIVEYAIDWIIVLYVATWTVRCRREAVG